MNFAAFTDLHSSIKTLRKIIKVISGKDVDAIVFTGDFVSLNQPITTELNNLEEMFLELDSLDIIYQYTSFGETEIYSYLKR